MNATNIKVTATSLTGEPYIEFTYTADPFGLRRPYLLHQQCAHLEQLSLYPIDKPEIADADKFIKSFRHF